MNISTLTPDKQVKLQYWLDVIRQCRASGLTNQVWCQQHDISLKSYYYWIAKIRKLALEELPRKNYGSRPVMEQTLPALDAAPEFTEVSFCGRQDSSAAPAAVLHIDTVTVDLFEDTPRELLEAILKAVRSC
ncbi:IS66 family insertion sequence element accessory protein TnpB [Lachnospiraceae bacterium 48-21]